MPARPTTSRDRDQQRRTRPISTRRLPGLPSDAENSRDSSTIAEKSATVAATIVVWPTSPSGAAGVLEHRHHQPQRGGGQRDDQQQRGC